MNTLFFQISTSVLLKSVRSISSSSHSFHGSISCFNLHWKNCVNYPYIKPIYFGSDSSVLARFIDFKCYSTKKKSTKNRKLNSEIGTMEGDDKEKEGFFVVRKGDIVGVYKSFSECQAQVGSSISDPPVSVYKGFVLPKDSGEYLASRGLQNAFYTIKATDLKDDLFGKLFPCPFVEPGSSRTETSITELPQKRPHDLLGSGNQGAIESQSNASDPLIKQQKLNHVPSDSRSCILHFDGASKGNPGPAGAGVVLRTSDGALICRIRQGLGVATCNAAEYHAVILGLKKALEMGYTSIQVLGDSKLVCMQDLNSDADAQANFAVSLADGEVQEVFQ